MAPAKIPTKTPFYTNSFVYSRYSRCGKSSGTLNEALRIGPLLNGLSKQGKEVREIIVVDSSSQDGTIELLDASRHNDSRFRLINDKTLPGNWVGSLLGPA